MSFMRRRVFCFSFILVLRLGFLANSAEPFRFYQKPMSLPEVGEVPGCALGWGTEEYTFLPPRDWRVKVESAQKQMTLQSSDNEAAITIDVLGTGPAVASAASPNFFREEVLRQFPNATIKEEFPCYTGASSGKGFEVEWLAFNKYKMASRVAFIPLSGGTLKFVLSATPPVLAGCQPSFGRLLTSFHKNPLVRPDSTAEAQAEVEKARKRENGKTNG